MKGVEELSEENAQSEMNSEYIFTPKTPGAGFALFKKSNRDLFG